MLRGVASDELVLRVSLSPNDARMAYRLVGFYEYGMAIQNLDRLIRQLSPAELATVNQMVAERDEFTVFTNLARRWQPEFGPLSEPREQPEDDFARRGLDWVIALARVELGAMLAGFAGNTSPFELLSPSPFELHAYRELILDGARSHYWALNHDPALPMVRKQPPTNPLVLSYSRRALMTQAFLRAAIQLGAGNLAPDELRLLVAWTKQTDALRSEFVTSISEYLALDGLRTTVAQREYVNACTALIEATKRELESGKATVVKLKY